MAGGDPEIEDHAQHLWDWFWQLNRGRQAGMKGWLALPAAEIRAWCEMTGNILRRDEIDVIRDMDQAFLVATAKPAKTDWAKMEAAQELTPAAFDAVFG